MLHRLIKDYCCREVVAVAPEDAARQAIELMRAHRVSSVLVCRERQPLGIITNRDLPRLLPLLRDDPQLSVGAVMSAPLLSVQENLSFHAALDLMIGRNLRHLPVVDDDGDLIGIVTETDITDAISADEMMRMMRIYEIMVEKVVTVSTWTTLGEAVALMQRLHVGSIVMAEQQRPLGLMTLKDIPDLLLRDMPLSTPVGTLVHQYVHTERGDTVAQMALDRMRELGVHHLVVVNELDEIIGMVTRSCFTRNLTRQALARILSNNRMLKLSVDKLEAQLEEMRLREMGNIFSHVVEHAPDAILIAQQGRVAFANSQARTLFGKVLSGWPIQNLADSDSRESIVRLLDAAEQETIAPTAPQFVPMRMLRSDGGHFAAEICAQAIAYNNERAILLTIRDISRHHREELFQRVTAQVLESIVAGRSLGTIDCLLVDMFADLFEGSATALMLVRDGSLRIECAPQLPDDFRTNFAAPLTPQYEQALHTSAPVALLSPQDPFADAHRRFGIGSQHRLLLLEPIRDAQGRLLGALALYAGEIELPLAEFRQAAAVAVRLLGVAIEHDRSGALVRKLQKAVESSGESMMITDREGTIEYVNPSFTRQTGYTAAEVLGKNPRILKSGLQSDAYYQRMWQTITAGQTFHAAITDRRKDGSFYPSIMTISPIFDEHGISNYVSTQQDLTDYQHIEEQLRQAQKMESLGVLVGGIAHNFNNMLAGIAGNLYLAREEAQADSAMRDYIAQSEQIVFSARDMIQQLMTFARKGVVQKKELQIESLMVAALRTARLAIREDVVLISEFACDDLTVHGDSTQLQQVLINLVNNAADAVAGQPSSRIEVSLKPADSEALRRRHPEMAAEQYVCLRVADNGCGIPESQKEHIFDPFFTTKEVGKGTGLGLSMTLGTVKSHGGFIELNAAPGQGSEFLVYLPLCHRVATVREQTAPLSISDGVQLNRTILLVDDDPLVGQSIRAVLEKVGCRILFARDGMEALTLFREQPQAVDLLITDVVMPNMGGMELMRRVRRQSAQLPVLFISGYDSEVVEISDSELEITRLLTKPFRFETLIEQIRLLLELPKGV